MLTQNPEMLELERGLRDHWIQLSLWGSWGPKGRWHAQYWFKGVHTHTPHTHSPTCSHTAGPLSSVNSPRVIVSSGEEGALLFIFVFYLIFSQLHQSLIDKNCIYVSGVHDVLIYGYVVKWLQSSYLTCPLAHIVTFLCVCDGNTKGVFSQQVSSTHCIIKHSHYPVH